MNLDEDALNVLLTEDVDLPTAIAASEQDEEPPSNFATTVGLLAALIAMLVCIFLYYT